MSWRVGEIVWGKTSNVNMESPKVKAEESGLDEVGNREPQHIFSNEDMLSINFGRSS